MTSSSCPTRTRERVGDWVRLRTGANVAAMSLPIGRVLGLGSAVVLAAVLLVQCGGPSGPIDGGRAMAHVRTMVGFGPRPFGSEALAKTADYIVAEGKKLDLEVKRHELLHEKEKKTIRNLYAQIDGADPVNGPILMFGAHYDTKLADGHTGADAQHNMKFVGAIDGGGAPAILLELARALKARTPKPVCNVWLYWIDAEESIDWEWNDNRALLGSEAFCKMLSATKVLPRVKAFVLLDLMGSKNVKFDKDGDSHNKLIALFEKAGKDLGIGERMFHHPTAQVIDYYTKNSLPWGIKDDHLNFKKYGVPSMLLIDFQYRIPAGLQKLKAGQEPHLDPAYEPWWHTPDDDLDAMDADSLAIAGNLVMQAFPALETFATGRQ